MAKSKTDKQEKSSPAAVTILDTEIIKIDLVQTNGNIRKHFDEKKIKELAGSISKVGVLQPILVRLATDSNGLKYLLIAGERRLRAAKIAGLEMIPARLLGVDDQQAAEIQALENLHREDLTPIEEAVAFKMLLDQGGYSVQSLAERIDKSENYVYRAIRLLELHVDAIKAIEEGHLTAAHGHQLLRVQMAQQAEFLKGLRGRIKSGDIFTVAELRRSIDDQVGRDLNKAPFPKDEPYAGQVACSTCPFNSGNQGMLFDGASKGRCTNPGCFTIKIRQSLEELIEKQKGKNVGMIFLGRQEGYNFEPKETDWKKARQLYDHEQSDPAIKKMMKESPDKFGWAVQHDMRYRPGEMKVKFYMRSSAAVRAALPDNNSMGSNGLPRKSAKQKFVDGEIQKALLEAAAESMRHPEKIKDWSLQCNLLVVDGLHKADNNPYIFERMGIEAKRSSAIPDLKKLNAHQLNEIIILQSVLGWQEVDNSKLKKLGVDVQNVTKGAREEAVKVWDAKKAAKGAKKS